MSVVSNYVYSYSLPSFPKSFFFLNRIKTGSVPQRIVWPEKFPHVFSMSAFFHGKCCAITRSTQDQIHQIRRGMFWLLGALLGSLSPLHNVVARVALIKRGCVLPRATRRSSSVTRVDFSNLILSSLDGSGDLTRWSAKWRSHGSTLMIIWTLFSNTCSLW